MAVCPVCQKPIEITDKHMGALFNCPHCRAVFFVGWDGQPEVTPEEVPDPEPPPVQETIIHTPMNEPDPEFGIPPNDASSDFVVNPAVEQEVFATADVPAADPYAAPEASEATGTNKDSAFDSNDFANVPVQDPEPSAQEESPYNFDQPLGDAPEPSGLPNPAADNFNDVTDFANSETPGGPLTYFVAIRGLELAETFHKLKEALTDSRFGWDSDEVVAQAHNGELILRGLNPTKAAILVSRIKDLPIEISWHQEVYGESARNP